MHEVRSLLNSKDSIHCQATLSCNMQMASAASIRQLH